jgi:hypothetical protein
VSRPRLVPSENLVPHRSSGTTLVSMVESPWLFESLTAHQGFRGVTRAAFGTRGRVGFPRDPTATPDGLRLGPVPTPCLPRTGQIPNMNRPGFSGDSVT